MDTNEGHDASCEDYLRRNNRRKREETDDETTSKQLKTFSV